jgi:hypothetical protein
MKSKHPISLLCLFLLLLLVCCKHEPPPKVCQYDSSVEEMKKWYYFKTGTWWVYQEQNTGVLDTITVYYDWDGLSQSGYDGFEWNGNSSLDGFNYYYTFNSSFSIYCLNQRECTCHKVDRAKGQAGNFVGAGQIFLYPIIKGNYTGSGSGVSFVKDVFSSLEIQDTMFNDVALWEVQDDLSEDGEHTRYWIGKNMGIVRAEKINAGEMWDLVNYSIIQ